MHQISHAAACDCDHLNYVAVVFQLSVFFMLAQRCPGCEALAACVPCMHSIVVRHGRHDVSSCHHALCFMQSAQSLVTACFWSQHVSGQRVAFSLPTAITSATTIKALCCCLFNLSLHLCHHTASIRPEHLPLHSGSYSIRAQS